MAGAPPKVYPEGTGIRLPAGRPLVLQVHYNLAGGDLPDRSAVALQLAEQVDREAFVLSVANTRFEVPPGEAEVTDVATRRLFGEDVPLRIHGIAPHMHRLGRSLQVEVWDAEHADCLVDVPRWDFDWQDLFFYEEPVDVRGSHRVAIACTWDTRGATEPVTWGDGTADEMCLALLYVTRR